MSSCINPHAPVLCVGLASYFIYPLPKSAREALNSVAGISTIFATYGIYRALDFKKTAQWAFAECIPHTKSILFSYEFSGKEQTLFADRLLVASIAIASLSLALYMLNSRPSQPKEEIFSA